MNTSTYKIALITAIFGDLDDLKPVPEQSVPVDKFCFTNNHNIPAGEFRGWKVIHPDYPRYDLKNRIKAKYFRTLSHTVKELQPYNIVIWLDGSIDIINPEFVAFMTNQVRTSGLVCFKHSVRNCIYEEAIVSKQGPKYTGEPIDEQIAQYRSEKYPERHGLIETGCFAKIINPETNKIMEQWWHENIKYSYQDQISLPYVLWKNYYNPSIIDKNIHDNEYCFRPARSEEKEKI